jgi:energy-coupling factor transporter ATP-binding protein EcfA2
MSDIEAIDLDNVKYFLDRTTILYGESGTGKSTIIAHMLHTLKPHADQIIVFSPTDPQNKSYSKGLVPTPLIHYNVTLKLLQDIWDRQEMMAAVYKRANDGEVLKRLYSKLSLAHVDESLRKAQRMREETYAKIREQYMDPGIVEKKVIEVDEKYNELMTLIYKRYIAENRAQLLTMNLTETERFTLDYLGFNPRIVLIFDDCSEQLQSKEIKKSKVFKAMFTRGRWAYMSIIIACHNDKYLEQDVRKGAFVNVFTSKSCAIGTFMNKTNCYDDDTVRKAKEAIKHIQEPKVGHRRMAYVREENKFFALTAKVFPNFSFCSHAIEQYCNKIKDNGTIAVDRGNKFYDSFFRPGAKK